MQTKIMVLYDDLTNETTVHGENLPDGQAAIFRMARALSAALCTVHDQMEERRLVLARRLTTLAKP